MRPYQWKVPKQIPRIPRQELPWWVPNNPDTDVYQDVGVGVGIAGIVLGGWLIGGAAAGGGAAGGVAGGAATAGASTILFPGAAATASELAAAGLLVIITSD